MFLKVQKYNKGFLFHLQLNKTRKNNVNNHDICFIIYQFIFNIIFRPIYFELNIQFIIHFKYYIFEYLNILFHHTIHHIVG